MNVKKKLATGLLAVTLATGTVFCPVAPMETITASAATTGSNVFTKQSEVNKYVLSQMVNRKKTIKVTSNFALNFPEFEKTIFKSDKKNTSSDSYYLAFIFKDLQWHSTISNGIYTTTITVSYRESSKETKSLDKKVTAYVKKLSKKSTYKKIKDITTYVVNRVSYDTSSNSNNLTAYKAYTKKVAKCQGYALLTYKMLTEAGIPCKILKGSLKASKEAHSWLAVKLKGKWYYLDPTLMDPIPLNGSAKKTDWDYFLFGTKLGAKTYSINTLYRLSNIQKSAYK